MENRIEPELKNIKECFTYLGVLRNVPLMDAMQESQIKYAQFIKIFESVWENGIFPSEEQLLSDLGEDYLELKKMPKAEAILIRIRRAIRKIFEELIRLKDSGVSMEEARKMLIDT